MKTEIDLLSATERALRALNQLEIACRPLPSTVLQTVSDLKQSTDALKRLAFSTQQFKSNQQETQIPAQRRNQTEPSQQRKQPLQQSTVPAQPLREPLPVSAKPWIAQNSNVNKPLRRKDHKTLK